MRRLPLLLFLCATAAHGLVFDLTCKGPCGPTAVTFDRPTVCTIAVGADYYGASVVRVEAASAVVQHASGPASLPVPNTSLYDSFELYEPIPIIAKPGETAQYPIAFTAAPGDSGTLTAQFEADGAELYLTPTGEGPCENIVIPGYGPYVQCRYPESFARTVARIFTILPAGSCPVTPTTLPPPPPPPRACHGHGWKCR